MASHGKKYRAAIAKIENEKLYAAKEAIELLKEIQLRRI